MSVKHNSYFIPFRLITVLEKVDRYQEKISKPLREILLC